MGLSWTIIFAVMATVFIIIPATVFLSNISRIRKEKTQ
jgi:hypothetical protein